MQMASRRAILSNLTLVALMAIPGCLLVSASRMAWAESPAIVVSDSDNNRVLIYNSPFRANDAAAVVLGQADFCHGSANRGGQAAPNTLNHPTALAKDSAGNLFVADTGNCRVAQFRPPFTNGMNANVIIQLAELGTCRLDHISAAGTIWRVSILGLAVDANGKSMGKRQPELAH